MLVVTTNSESETDQLAGSLAACLEKGIVVALSGELGAGKTRLVRGVCDGLGIDPAVVNSPTFVLLQQYRSDHLQVCHFDTYRLEDAAEFESIGGPDWLEDESIICFVEWADRIADVLPIDHLSVSVVATKAESREFTFVGHGPRARTVVEKLARAVE